ncbi:NAD(P)H-binding protein [Endozoicomonas sp. 4G]|uniref:NAD(P)H-binding protein n=1 Tax=Endozoicomonas sp. 4G TaxID=2872754 RepID=UPI0020784D80|nr:NAD(P)H-binding protein [Endozoicomonas sp. 4G]
MTSIAIFGATGLTGSHLVQQAIDDSSINQIVVFTRRPLPLKHPKLIEKIVNFADLTEHHRDLAVDTVYCCLGTTIKKAGSKAKFRHIDIDLVEQVGQAAKQAGAKQFVVISSQGASEKSWFFYSRSKAEMENKLSALFHNSGCQLIICQPSLLLGERNESRSAEDFGIKMNHYLSWCWRGRLKNYQPIFASDLAGAMLSLAKACKVPRMIVNNRNLHQVVATANQSHHGKGR